MKKQIYIFYAILLAVLLCACTVTDTTKNTESNNSTSGVSVTEEAESETTETVRPEIKKLIDNNIYAITEITNMFANYGEEVINGHFYEVKSDKIKSTQDMKEFLNNTYTSSAVQVILNQIDGLYTDIDGKLCIDINKMGGKGYYVNWDNYTFTVNSIDGNECKFTVSGELIEPAETVTATPYVKEITAVKENGKWLLNGEFY